MAILFKHVQGVIQETIDLNLKQNVPYVERVLVIMLSKRQMVNHINMNIIRLVIISLIA